MALNYTVSNTFSPGQTISSSLVNTNFSDIANVFNGLEAETKTLSKLKIDADPTIDLGVATKQYVDHYSKWRRPILTPVNTTTVTVEPGLDGTTGEVSILFPDGQLRTDTSTARYNFVITRNAVLTTSGAQSGLRGGLSEATNTWYAIYAVKVTDSSTLFVTVGDTVLPLVANYATLNLNFGANGWVYLGMIRNGDNSGATGDILPSFQAGNMTIFYNQCSNSGANIPGTLLASTAGANSLAWAYSAGTGTTDLPTHITHAFFTAHSSGGGTGGIAHNGNTTVTTYGYTLESASQRQIHTFLIPAQEGFQIVGTNSTARAITCSGFVDGVLGVGSNPLL